MQSEPLSKHFQSYVSFMDRHFASSADLRLSPETQKKYNIAVLHPDIVKRKPRGMGMRLVYVGYGVTIAAYIVDLGRFRVTVRLLNLPGNVPVQSS